MFPLAGCLLRVALREAISLLRSYQLGKSTGATNIHMPVIHTKLSDFIQPTKFRKYPVLVSSEKNPADNRNVFVLGGRFVFCVVDNHSQHGLSEPENIICTNVVVACFFVQKPILVKLSKGDGFLLSFDELILWHRGRRRNFLKYDFSGIFSCENIG